MQAASVPHASITHPKCKCNANAFNQVQSMQSMAMQVQCNQSRAMQMHPMLPSLTPNALPQCTQASRPATPAKKAAPPRKQLRERRVPESPFGRAMGFAGLGAGLVMGSISDGLRGAWAGKGAEQKEVCGLGRGCAEGVVGAVYVRGICLLMGSSIDISRGECG